MGSASRQRRAARRFDGIAITDFAERTVCIDDLRAIAKRRLPRVVFDYIDGGAESEITLRENCRAFDEVVFRPRNAVGTTPPSLKTSVLGTELELPFLLGPVGSSRLFFPRGECVAAREATAAGTIYTLSTLSGCRLEDVKTAASGTVWYQLYIMGGRAVATAAIERAREAGYGALVITIDTPVAGERMRDTYNGAKHFASGNLWEMIPVSAQILAKPGWMLGFIGDGGLMKFPNVVLPGIGPMPYADVGAAFMQSAVTWADVEWIARAWGGPIVIKGVHGAEDARRAVEVGAAAIVVSNHGGRQLDGVAATLRVLPEVVAAVGGDTEILLDGGIRRGSDIVKAICMGAKGVLIGRAYAYGLGAAGGKGVARAIHILRTGVDRTLRLLGCTSVGELDESYVEVPAHWRRA